MAATNPGSGFNVPSSAAPAGLSASAPKKRKGHRAGKKKKKNRRPSFAINNDEMNHDEGMSSSMANHGQSFYGQRHNLSGTSIDSATLLDHREQSYFMRPRRSSNAHQSPAFHQATQSVGNLKAIHGGDSGSDDDAVSAERAPLLSTAARLRSEPAMSFGAFGSPDVGGGQLTGRRDSSRTSGRKDYHATNNVSASYDVNYPPSIPGSPRTRAADRDWRLEDAMLIDELNAPDSSHHDDFTDRDSRRTPSPKSPATPFERRKTYDFEAQGDVCFPHHEDESEMDNEELRARRSQRMRSRRRRIRGPQLAFLEKFAQFEKQGLNAATKAKKITEPQLINGRLRPIQKGWYQPEEDAPYRFTYFNDEYQSTIHSSTISELVQSEGQGSSFRELFIPDRPILLDSSDSESEDDDVQQYASDLRRSLGAHNVGVKELAGTRQASVAGSTHVGPDQARNGTLSPHRGQGPLRSSEPASGEESPVQPPRPTVSPPPEKEEKPIRYGERPVWWLDVLSPTDAEMRVIARTFGIHGLTTEDIMMQEAREKVELFQHYYFVHYRTFNQDPSSEDYLEPINLYIVVFRDGVLSFHFSPTPHPANVRRRVRMLRDYMFLTPDWIAYAIIDDITDVYQPLIQSVEEEVDEIDADIVKLHAEEDPRKARLRTEKNTSDDGKSSSGSTFVETGADMLRRVGECRKKVMGLYRLLGSKADVIKGFAKRCNEQWEVAPRSDIGIYLGDIQDHIVTMTGNLSHYEMILARSHQNYLAQINIRMNERAEQTNDVLGKLTVLGTIVLPMNIITGLWGMNVWVPGQEYEGSLTWFWCITGGLIFFGLACFLIAKRIYRIV
ncbi:unnamed protein product [Discula destructiva]